MGRLVTAATLCLSLSGAAAGAVIHVDADAIGANDGSSWTDAYTDLQDALAVAGSSDEIRVAQGTYKPTTGSSRIVSFQLVAGAAVYGGYAGYGESGPDERDWETHETILSGDIGTEGNDWDNSYRVVVGASNATLDGFTVTRGWATDLNEYNSGAGMYNYRVTGLDVANCTFSANRANTSGGGMYVHDCSPTITNCTFSGNLAASGGGMRSSWYSSPAVTNCTFSNNTANYGAGMMNSQNGYPTVTNCIFSGNMAVRHGGGIYIWGCSPILANCTFSSNEADEYGGGIYCRSPSILSNCTLWGNWAPTGPEVYDTASSCTVSYSDIGQVAGFTDGGGNINADPLFVDADGPDDIVGTLDDDLHLQPGSPCIDAADGRVALAEDKDGNPRDDDPDTPNTGIGWPNCAEMGAYELQTGHPWTPPPVTPFGGGCGGAVSPVLALAFWLRRRRS